MQIKKLDVDRCIAVINESDACEINLEHWNAKQWLATTSISTTCPHGWQALEAISHELHLGDYGGAYGGCSLLGFWEDGVADFLHRVDNDATMAVVRYVEQYG